MGGARAGRADKGTGKKQDIKITGASTLASDEVDRMVKDAEKFADEVRSSALRLGRVYTARQQAAPSRRFSELFTL